MNFDLSMYNAGVIAVVLAIVHVIKPYVATRYVPLLPLILGMLGGVLAYYTDQITTEVGGSVAAQVIWVSFLYGAIASTLFKVGKTTVKGQ